MQTIGLCMIVKNEEFFLEQCLNSVKAFVDEIIIVDTGSTDRTKEIAARFTNKIYDFKWCDDFSAARNESLKHATCEWILVLDADEVIARKDHVRIRNLIADQGIEAYIFTQRNYFKSSEDMTYGSFKGMKVRATGSEAGFVSSQGDDYSESKNTIGWLPIPIVRLFRKSKTVSFSGVVHEDVSPSIKGEIVACDVPIHHFGKLNPETWKKKWAIYEKLGEKKAAEDKDYHALFELGRQYLAAKKIDLAKEMFEKSISLNDKFWVTWFNLGSINLIEGNLDSASECLEKAKALNPRAVAVYGNLGVVYVKKKDFKKAIENFTKAIQLKPDDAAAYKNLGLCYDEIGERQKAYSCFKKAIELNPKYKETIKLDG